MSTPYFPPQDKVPLPPADAETLTTCCDYCIVACGYKVYRWPVGKVGGPKADQNAFGVDFPTAPLTGRWVSPNQHNVVSVAGKPHHVVVVPDADTEAVNLNGDHSIRGGCLAQKCYNPEKPTKDRLQHPMLRVSGKLTPVSWDVALDVVAEVSQHVIEKHGVHAWAQKMYSYQYYENTYALTKFALASIRTPCFAWHDNPTVAPSAPGFRDAGFDIFAASYKDWSEADTLYIAGTDPFETKTIIWNEWIMKGIGNGMKVVMATPRKTTGPAYAEKTGGLHLWLYPGSDTPVHLAISRVILENGWEDSEWIEQYTSNKWESDSGFGQGTRNTPWQWRTTWGQFQTKGFADYKDWVLSQEESSLEFASKVSGVPQNAIVRAAELMAKPRSDGERPKTSIAIEKGLYWSNNYLNTASIASLALLCGTGNRPGRMISRLGGHQRGGRKGGRYPLERSPEKFAGRRRKPLDLDRWVEQGHVRFAYVVGTTWLNAMTASGGLTETFRRLTADNPHQISGSGKDEAVAALKKRIASGGMALVHQDIYQRPITRDFADVVLPAATWGEEDFTRCNGERRIRLYQKFYDAPGEARPDWWIVGQIAQRMGFEGFDWKDSNAVFEESARFGRKSRTNYHPLVWMAKKQGVRAHDLLKTYGTTGIQCPIRYESGKLVGTVRLHDSTLELPAGGPEGPTVHPKWLTSFNTQSGKANFVKSPWSHFSDFYEFLEPRGEELWITNGRINEIWQSCFDDVLRRPYIGQRWPDNFIEIHPDDAAKRGIESGDVIMAECDRVPVQVGGFVGRDTKDLFFSGLREAGHIKLVKGSVEAVAVVIPVPRPGVAFMYFLHPTHVANNLVPRVTDPISNNYRFKLGVGTVTKTGESPYKKSFESMSFATRTIV